MTSSSRALWIGPAAARVLAGRAPLRVHSVFPSTVNLEAWGTGAFVALCGPPGGIHPHTVALADWGAWQPRLGSPVVVTDHGLVLQGQRGPWTLALGQAQRPAARPLPRITRLGQAYRTCWPRLEEPRASTGAHPAPLHQAALDLAAAARAWRPGTDAHGLNESIAALVGLGAGLTPAGDDCLCGFLAALRSAGPGRGLPEAVSRAIAANLHRTGSLSAYLLRLGIEDFWPGPLLDLAQALAEDLPSQAAEALRALCRIGHSSGRDLGAGFLLGLDLQNRSTPPRP